MITAQMVIDEQSAGLSAVCAWCEHWHEAKSRGDAITCGHPSCGGPGVGRGFPDYKGPMEGNLGQFCFICGRGADAGVEIGGRVLGVCNGVVTGGTTCLQKLKGILARQRVVVREFAVPVIGDRGKPDGA